MKLHLQIPMTKAGDLRNEEKASNRCKAYIFLQFEFKYTHYKKMLLVQSGEGRNRMHF